MSDRNAPWPPGTPCWADIGVPDVEEARGFYTAVLGWHYDEPGPDDGGYTIARVGDRAVAGIGPLMARDQPVAWTLYLASADVDATASRIVDAGGAVLVPPGDVGVHGRMCIAADPTGAAFGVWQAGDHIGAERVNEPGCLTWEDLRSDDPAAAHAFYTAVFGYELHSIDGAPADYQTFHHTGDEAPLGGMGGFMGPAGPSHWAVYFGVETAAQAVAAARASGGTVLAEPFDTPYGQMATVADPFGGVFQVVETSGSDQPDRSA